MTDASDEAVLEGDKEQVSLSDALERLSMTTELDSALLNHLSLLDEYMFHVECLSQLFRMVASYSSSYLICQAFFDLAQANRDKSASGGMRIGEVGFDQRMQAGRRMCVSPFCDYG